MTMDRSERAEPAGRAGEDEFARRRRRRNLVIGLALAGFVAVVFFATMAKMKYLLPAS